MLISPSGRPVRRRETLPITPQEEKAARDALRERPGCLTLILLAGILLDSLGIFLSSFDD